jgi:hypothetical protein
MAQIAASIEYEGTSPPAGFLDDMRALPGATLWFLSIKTIDGFKVQAALWQPRNRAPAETTIIVQVHGSGGNLASLPLRVIAGALSARGYAALSISTRQHDEQVNTDNFLDVRRDEAAVLTAKALGYRSIVLQGLGTVQVASMPPATGTLRSKASSSPVRSGNYPGSHGTSWSRTRRDTEHWQSPRVKR